MRKNAAAILAGGSGKRFGAEIPKQFVSVSGKTIIEYTIEAFEKNPLIDEICVVVNEAYMDIMNETAVKRGFSKLKAVIKGGLQRYDSSKAAIDYYKGQDINILIHDAARPNVSQDIITAAVRALNEYEAVCTALAAADTIAIASEKGLTISEIPPRSLMYQVQTPQGFRLDTIKRAYEKAFEDPDFHATDDCGVVKKYLPDVKIHIIKGSPENIKITYMDDLKLL